MVGTIWRLFTDLLVAAIVGELTTKMEWALVMMNCCIWSQSTFSSGLLAGRSDALVRNAFDVEVLYLHLTD